MSILESSILQLSKALSENSLTVEQICRAFYDQSQAMNPSLNAFIHLANQKEYEQKINQNNCDSKRTSKLSGLPIAHKDLFCTSDYPTTCGSKMLENYRSPFNATLVETLETAGMISFGKTNMDEFAMGSANETSFYGPVVNPFDATKVAGGSSGGSAAAVAARMVPIATGSDTGGSIRQPAAFCGVTGFKPTYGRISRWGMVAYASSLDQAGPIAKSAEDCAVFMDTAAHPDPKDSTSSLKILPSTVDQLPQSQDYFKGKVFGYLPTWLAHEGLDSDVLESFKITQSYLESLGAQCIPLDLQSLHYAMAAYYIIAPAEASSNLSRFDGVRFGHQCESPKNLEDLYKRSRQEGFGKEVKRRILTGTYVLSEGYFDAYYKQAQKIRRFICEDFNKAFQKVHMIITPTTPTTAFSQGVLERDPVEVYLQDIFTIPVNLAGLPAISFPVESNDINAPIGMQFIGQRFNDTEVLNGAHAYQLNTQWHRRPFQTS